MTAPFAPDDADQILADFGVDLVCAAVPSVTRGLLDDEVVEREQRGNIVTKRITVLKVKRGAFGDTPVKGTRVSVTSRDQEYSIDNPLPHGPSLFDWYALQLVKQRSDV